MFPLGSVIFPFTAVPLRVFEDRYQVLVDRVLAEESEFGTVLIERGSEVGGGDARSSIGTALRLAGVTDLEDGHRAIVVVATGRIRVERWLDDDPHPWAIVAPEPDDDDADAQTAGRLEAVKAKLAKVMVLASELGADTADVDLDVAEDPLTASYQLAALAPVTPLDARTLLTCTGPSSRLVLTERMLDERIELIEAQLAAG
jgi:Lon protease-like protein